VALGVLHKASQENEYQKLGPELIDKEVSEGGGQSTASMHFPWIVFISHMDRASMLLPGSCTDVSLARLHNAGTARCEHGDPQDWTQSQRHALARPA